jgi:hypothetical protein
MIDPYEISPNEHGIVRVFTTDLDPEGNAAITPENVGRLLGAGIDLDPSRVEVFPSSRLEPMRLSEYLREGYGIPAKDLEGKASALDALKGLVILVASSAFREKAATLEPRTGIRFVGAFAEPTMRLPERMAPSASAEGALQARGAVAPPSPGRRPGGLTVLAALLLAAAILLVVVL